MAKEAKVSEILKNAGYEPQEGKAIIVKYAPENLSDQIAKFFSTEYYVMQICKESIVLVPFGQMTLALKKEVSLEIPFSKLHQVSVSENFLNYRIVLETEDGCIRLSVQQAELSDFRSSGYLAYDAFRCSNWHKKNLSETLETLKKLDCYEPISA